MLLAGVPAAVSSQSLGAVAKKERERRVENKTKGSEVREFSEIEIFGEPEEPDEQAEERADGAEAAESEPESSESQESAPAAGDADGVEELERQAQQRRRDEASWRARFGEARRELDEAKAYRAALDELHLTQGERYIDDNGNTVIQDLAHLRELIREADQRVADAERGMTRLEEQARREGIPPGWRR